MNVAAVINMFKTLSGIIFSVILVFQIETTAMPYAQLRCVGLFSNNSEIQIQTYTIQNRQIRFLSIGDSNKQPVLFIHGSPGSAENWLAFLNNTELQKKFHLIAIDRPGYGGSGYGKSEQSLQQQALELISVLKYNHSQKSAIIIGHSFGGPVAARMAMDFPEKISGAIFISSLADPELITQKWYRHVAYAVTKNFKRMTPLKVFFEEIDQLKDQLQQLSLGWRNLKTKIILIHGGKDQAVSVLNTNYMTDHLSKNVLVDKIILSERKHAIPKQDPELIIESLLHLADVISATNSAGNGKD